MPDQRMNTFASLHFRNVDIMVHMSGGQESPTKSKGGSELRSMCKVINFSSFGHHRKWILSKGDSKPCAQAADVQTTEVL